MKDIIILNYQVYLKIINKEMLVNFGWLYIKWMIKTIKALYQLLTNNEKNIFNLFLQFYNNIKKDNIDKYVSFNKSLDFFIENLIIIKIEADEEYVNLEIKKIMTDKKNDMKHLEYMKNNILKQESQKYERINSFTNEINQSLIISKYNKLIQKIEDILIADKERNELKKKFEDLVKSINKVKTGSLNIKDFKDILIEQIKLLINNSENNKENYEKYYNDYKLLIKNNNIMNKKNSSYYNKMANIA